MSSTSTPSSAARLASASANVATATSVPGSSGARDGVAHEHPERHAVRGERARTAPPMLPVAPVMAMVMVAPLSVSVSRGGGRGLVVVGVAWWSSTVALVGGHVHTVLEARITVGATLAAFTPSTSTAHARAASWSRPCRMCRPTRRSTPDVVVDGAEPGLGEQRRQRRPRCRVVEQVVALGHHESGCAGHRDAAGDGLVDATVEVRRPHDVLVGGDESADEGDVAVGVEGVDRALAVVPAEGVERRVRQVEAVHRDLHRGARAQARRRRRRRCGGRAWTCPHQVLRRSRARCAGSNGPVRRRARRPGRRSCRSRSRLHPRRAHRGGPRWFTCRMVDATKAFSGFSVRDVPEAKAFYEDVLGVEVDRGPRHARPAARRRTPGARLPEGPGARTGGLHGAELPGAGRRRRGRRAHREGRRRSCSTRG